MISTIKKLLGRTNITDKDSSQKASTNSENYIFEMFEKVNAPEISFTTLYSKMKYGNLNFKYIKVYQYTVASGNGYGHGERNAKRSKIEKTTFAQIDEGKSNEISFFERVQREQNIHNLNDSTEAVSRIDFISNTIHYNTDYKRVKRIKLFYTVPGAEKAWVLQERAGYIYLTILSNQSEDKV
ncbi:hypothetical protein SM124_13325 [Bacillus sp. 31A1R]|uniref:Uncharacterized protein n=1 Tax=Robertmurraya mangrovi TaxID=3098077 RepID=A0ABU5J009_9BACI|nr:hypothetical protein [Bacillus sp. 31A1R]MDZ5472711.1 hypothetical protein [Bacillus sp. 31A1R]